MPTTAYWNQDEIGLYLMIEHLYKDPFRMNLLGLKYEDMAHCS